MQPSEYQEQYYEYIVIGCGGVGSGALYWLSRKAGKGVLGLEQFELGHHRGGSQDVSRVVRLMYHDDRYTQLTPDTIKVWQEVEDECGLKLVHLTGGYDLVRKGCARECELEDTAAAMDHHNIPYERVTARDVRRRYPQLKFTDDVYGLYQATHGLVDAALANAVHIQLARAHGATVIDQCPVIRLEPTADGGARIFTPKGVFSCRRVVVAAGAWVNHILGSVGVHIPLIVSQEQVTYFATPHLKKFTKENCPTFSFLDEEQNFYIIPMHGNTGVKIGIDAGGPVVTADSRNFTPDPVREKACADFFKKNVPEALGPVLFTKTCLYAMTRDRDFVVDSLASRGLPQIFVCCGSGHMFKFASLMGKILSQMATEGKSQYDISGFKFERDAITNPNFQQTFKVTYNPKVAKL